MENNEPIRCTISVPMISDQALENLRRIIANKGDLIKHALGTDDLTIAVSKSTGELDFPWFTIEQDGDAEAYAIFVQMLCSFASVRTRINNKPDASQNEKYAFRCFLLRLGMLGDEFKPTRKVLLRRLSGNSAFKSR